MYCFLRIRIRSFQRVLWCTTLLDIKIRGIKNEEFYVDFNVFGSGLKSCREKMYKEKHMQKVQTRKFA